MTCVIGYVDNDRSYVISDSAGTNGSDQQSVRTRATGKVFRIGDLLVGCTTSFRMAQLLRYRLVLPERNNKDVYHYMADLIDAVRTCLKEGGYATKDEERERGGTFLVVCSGRLFCVESDYHFYEVFSKYNAIGSGDDLARGALFALEQLEILCKVSLPVEQKLKTAMLAAQHYNASVRPPFIIESIDIPEEDRRTDERAQSDI